MSTVWWNHDLMMRDARCLEIGLFARNPGVANTYPYVPAGEGNGFRANMMY